jgi:hypothetical protein
MGGARKFRNCFVGHPAAFLIGLLLGSSVVLAAVAGQRSGSGQKFAPLLRPATVNELEWGLLRARLSQAEDRVNTLSDTGIGSCCASYWYDSAKSRIIARFRYAPDTLNRLTLQEAKDRLSKAAIGAIGSAKYELEQQPGVTLELKDFEVEFVTWDQHAQFKIFAVYTNDQVELVDRALK